ncbi:MAG TPA: response regulator [Anaerolineales bacterium]|nr:response regulator [Anaerolineales bacterium]
MPTILLVEDEPDSAELMAHILEMESFHVVRARTGDEGLSMAKAEPVDVVLLDVMLPGVDGFEVCRRLRADPRTALLPIAFISAKTRDEDRQAGLQAGADVYLAKPISRAALVSATRWLLDGRNTTKPDLTGLPAVDTT